MFDQCFVPCSFEHPGSSQLAWPKRWEGKLTRDKGQGARGNSVVSGGISSPMEASELLSGLTSGVAAARPDKATHVPDVPASKPKKKVLASS
jgi:hypothetical protein